MPIKFDVKLDRLLHQIDKEMLFGDLSQVRRDYRLAGDCKQAERNLYNTRKLTKLFYVIDKHLTLQATPLFPWSQKKGK